MKSVIRRFMAVCLAVLCLLGVSASFDCVFSPHAYAAAQKAQAGDVYVVKVKQLNVRSGPSVKKSIKTRLKKGAEVTYRKSEKGWWYVDYPNGSGYVDKKFLKKKDTGTETAPIISFDDPNTTHTTTCKLRVRAKPSFKGKIIGKLKKATAVTVLSEKGKWSQIRYNNKDDAWVYTKYLKKKK